jgi:hypothetical protein
LFYVAAIGGKSPRAFNCLLEHYDGIIPTSSAQIVEEL